MKKSYLRRTCERWSAGTQVEVLRDVTSDKVVVQVAVGKKKHTLEIFKDDLVWR